MKKCPTCGEMIGTARKRYPYQAIRWPATVYAYQCERCHADICSKCCRMFKTNEIIGHHNRRTEGNHIIKVNTYRNMILCESCGKVEAEEREKDKKEPDWILFLKDKGLY